MSPDLGLLLGIFILGVSTYPWLQRVKTRIGDAIWRFRQSTVRYRVKNIEWLLKNQPDVRTHGARLDKIEKWMEQESDIEDRLKVIEDWLLDKTNTVEMENGLRALKKSAKRSYRRTTTSTKRERRASKRIAQRGSLHKRTHLHKQIKKGIS